MPDSSITDIDFIQRHPSPPHNFATDECSHANTWCFRQPFEAHYGASHRCFLPRVPRDGVRTIGGRGGGDTGARTRPRSAHLPQDRARSWQAPLPVPSVRRSVVVWGVASHGPIVCQLCAKGLTRGLLHADADTVCVSYEAFLKESYIVFDSTARSGRDFYFDIGMHQVQCMATPVTWRPSHAMCAACVCIHAGVTRPGRRGCLHGRGRGV